MSLTESKIREIGLKKQFEFGQVEVQTWLVRQDIKVNRDLTFWIEKKECKFKLPLLGSQFFLTHTYPREMLTPYKGLF
jgi:hypothetical protein